MNDRHQPLLSEAGLALYALPESMGRSNAWLLETETRRCLIDASPSPANLAGAEDRPLEAIVLTHGHYDHLVALKALRAEGAQVYASAVCSDWLGRPDYNLSTFFGAPVRFDAAEQIVEEGEAIAVGGGWQLMPYALPGHTPGDMLYTLVDGDARVHAVVAGDIVFADSIGRSDLPGGDAARQRASLTRFVSLAADWPAEALLCSGHGTATPLGRVLASNIWLSGELL